MSDEDNSSRTMSDESDAGSNQGDVDSIYDESDVDPGPMTARERERLLVMALSALMSGSQNRLDYDLLAMQFPGRTSTDIQGEMDRMFREHSHLSLGMIEEQGSMARFIALVRMRVEIEYQLQQWLESELEQWMEETLQEILEERFDAMLNVSAGTTRNDLRSDANAALTHSQQLGEGEVNIDDEEHDSGFEGFTADDEDDEQHDSGFEGFTADDEDDDSDLFPYANYLE